MSLASSHPRSCSPRVWSAAAVAHSFAQPHSILPGAARPARGSRFAYAASIIPSHDLPVIGAPQGALTASQSLAPRVLFL